MCCRGLKLEDTVSFAGKRRRATAVYNEKHRLIYSKIRLFGFQRVFRQRLVRQGHQRIKDFGVLSRVDGAEVDQDFIFGNSRDDRRIGEPQRPLEIVGGVFRVGQGDQRSRRMCIWSRSAAYR